MYYWFLLEQIWLRWRRPAAIVNDRPVLSSERAPHMKKPAIVTKIWSWAPDAAWQQERLADRPSIITWLRFWLSTCQSDNHRWLDWCNNNHLAEMNMMMMMMMMMMTKNILKLLVNYLPKHDQVIRNTSERLRIQNHTRCILFPRTW
jgi:hypothetical protein